jgi:hypothetical protein
MRAARGFIRPPDTIQGIAQTNELTAPARWPSVLGAPQIEETTMTSP